MTGIIDTLKAAYDQKQDLVEAWIKTAFTKTPPAIYSSVDVRHSGIKLAPVDTNLFPAGFNNLSVAARARAVEQFKAFVGVQDKPISRILIIPENHTRNLGYLANLRALVGIWQQAGYETQIGSLAAPSGEPVMVEDANGQPIVEHPLIRRGNLLATEGGFIPDLIVLNNDLTSGFPEMLQGVTQTMTPNPNLGWYRRKKSIHFRAYASVVQEFAPVLGVDPWVMSALFHQCGRVNFGERTGIECVALGVEKVLRQIKAKYDEYGISETPYVFIKADAGTYGMGIMTARSGDEVMELNKKVRNKMNVIKEGVHSTEVIIQEGVPTIDLIEGFSAEPMLYLANGVPIGGAYRLNEERDAYGNLNASGMRFKGMCDEAELTDDGRTTIRHCNFTVLGLIARLATLAASREEYGDEYMI